MKLKYIGNGGAIIGIPARDLTEEEVKTIEKEFDVSWLIKTGLYKAEEEIAPKRTKTQKEES